VVTLEAERMSRLVLGEEQVKSEKEVVANERRYRVDDDVESSVSEQLWSMAYTEHAYHWPTIGWMRDIDAYSSDDCRAFYKTFYAPNNATIVVVGDVTEAALLSRMQKAYGETPPSELPIEDVKPEPPQVEERHAEVEKPTATQKVTIGYKSPALGDFDHPALAILSEVLFGGRASRLHEELVRKREIATDVRVFVGLFREPSLMEIYASARGQHTAEELLTAIETELERVKREPVSTEEIERARARMELGLLAGLDTVDGKASTIGFYDTVLARPSAAFERLEAYGRVTPSDLLRVARRYLVSSRRTVIFVRPNAETPKHEAAE
jgi:zinc protease